MQISHPNRTLIKSSPALREVQKEISHLREVQSKYCILYINTVYCILYTVYKYCISDRKCFVMRTTFDPSNDLV